MFLQRYINFITTYFKAVLFFVAVATGVFGYYAQDLNIDASAETLLLEDDMALKLTREVHARYDSSDYLVVAFSPKEYLLSNTTLSTIRSIKESLEALKGVRSVTTLLDVPLLESPPMEVSDVVKNVRTLSSENINIAMVEQEFTTSPLYAKNLVSADFKTTAILVNIKDDPIFQKLLKERNFFIELQQSRTLNKEEKKEFEFAKKALKEYSNSTRDEVHNLIKNIRSSLDPFRKDGEIFLGGVMMIADDMISFVKSDIAVYGVAILLIMVAILWVIFRQMRFVVLPILVSICAVVITTGINTLVGS